MRPKMITALALLLLVVLVSPGAEAKKKGKAAKFVMHGDQTLDVQPFADDATEYHCRLHDSKHGKATKGNPKYCETAGGASVLVVESYGNDDDDEEEDDGGYDATGRRTRMLKGGPKRPKKYVTSIIDSETGYTYYIDRDGEVTQTHTSEFAPELDAPEVPAVGDKTINQDVLAEMQAGSDEGRKLRGAGHATASPHSPFLDNLLPVIPASDQNQNRRLADDGRIIDIMVLWTPAAEAAQPGTTAAERELDIRDLIDTAIEMTNQAYDNSGVETMLRLVHAQRAEGYAESTDYSQNLYNLTPWHSSFDGTLSWVEGVRNQYGADLVAMIVDGGSYCGIAWLGPSSSSVYSVTSFGCATNNLSFAHEVGHNIGCNHDKGTTNSCNEPDSNYGYRDPNAQFRSVLAYGCTTGQCDNNAGGYCARKPFFSRPDMLWEGKPMGSSGGTTGVTDNAGHINANRYTMANYRQSVLPVCGTDSDCDDGNSCTVNTCDVVCQTEIVSDCCGNGICEANESTSGCIEDCFCGNGICDVGENELNCAEDCKRELITTMAAGNGQRANMFNIDVSSTIEIATFNINCDTAGGGNTVRLYHKTGTYNSFVSNSAAWTLFYESTSVTCNPSGTFTPVHLPTPLTLDEGPHAFLVYNQNQLDYTNGDAEGSVYPGTGNHPEITFYEGIGKPDEFGTTTYSPRIWNGRIDYALADLEPTSSPTKAPTSSPTESPTNSPTTSPTPSPTSAPTTPVPTASPTASPSQRPSSRPSVSPTSAPSTPVPTSSPTESPTGSPTTSPTASPSSAPSTPVPTKSPTASPSQRPSSQPSASPTPKPSSSPSTPPTDVNECLVDNGGCDSLTTCTNVPNGRICGDCPSGYSGSGEAGCVDRDECSEGTDNCHANASCENTSGGYTCTCNAGYSGNGVICTDNDECSDDTHTCDVNASCQNTLGSFTCSCNAGFTGDGYSCTNINECINGNNGGCDPLTSCVDTPGSYYCTPCPSGYTGTGESGCVEIVFAFTDSSEGFMVTSRASVDPDPAADSCWGYSAGDSDLCTRDVPLGTTLHNFIWADWMVDPLDGDFRKAEYEIKVNGERNKDVLVFVPDAVKGNSYQLHIPLDELSPVPKVGDTVTVKLKIELDSGAKLQTQNMPLNIVDLPPEPTSSPTKAPSGSPTTSPTKAPSPSPTTASPTASPSKAPSPIPTTGAPTETHSASPSNSPTSSPTKAPTGSPTPSPTKAPSTSPTQAPSPSPTTGAPTTSCSLPTGPGAGQWLIITTDGCTDGKVFDVNEDITLIFYSDAIEHSSVSKIEVEFKVKGDKDRKTKFKLDSAADLSIGDPSFPQLHPDGTYRLTIRMGDIGRIGGWDGGVTSAPNDPIQSGEWTQYKFKVEDARDRYDIQRDDLFAA